MLIFGVPSNMTRIDFKTKCDKVRLNCFAIGKLETQAEYFRVTLKPKARQMWQRVETEKSVDMG